MLVMRICCSIIVGLSAAGFASGQTLFWFQNYYPPLVDAPIMDAQGVRLAGSAYAAELWGGPAPDRLAPAVSYSNKERLITPFFVGQGAGYFRNNEGSATILGVPPGGWAWLQVRAWDARLGSTYEDVVALGIGGYGESPLFYAQGSDPFDYKALPAPLIGLESFRLRPVIPEPSTWALIAVGGGVLVWMTRRKR